MDPNALITAGALIGGGLIMGAAPSAPVSVTASPVTR